MKKLLLLLSLLGTITCLAVASIHVLRGASGVPITATEIGGSVAPNSNVTYRVVFQETTTEAGAISIQATDGVYSYHPRTVNFGVGVDHVDFVATFGPNIPASWQMAVTGGGTTLTVQLMAPPQVKR